MEGDNMEGDNMGEELEFVKCPECGNEQADMGNNVACEECGFGPMPTSNKCNPGKKR